MTRISLEGIVRRVKPQKLADKGTLLREGQQLRGSVFKVSHFSPHKASAF